MYCSKKIDLGLGFCLILLFCHFSTAQEQDCPHYLSYGTSALISSKSYLIDFTSFNLNGPIPSITEKVLTPFGPVVLRTKDLKDLAATIQNYGLSDDKMTNFVDQVFSRQRTPEFVDPSFLNWLLSSYEHALTFFDTYNLNPTSTLTLTLTSNLNPFENSNSNSNGSIISNTNSGQSIDAFKNLDPEFQHTIALNAVLTKARKELKISPIRFNTQLGPIDAPTSWLHEFEAIWIFTILMREPVVRKLLAPVQSLKHLTAGERNEVIFMISAYPELLSLAGQLDRMGFKPGDYFLTDGIFTESAKVQLGQHLLSSLVLVKDFPSLVESSYAFISIDDDIFYSLPFDAQEFLVQQIQIIWREFIDRHQNLFINNNAEITLDLDTNFKIELNSFEPNHTQIMALFYVFLLNQPKRLTYSTMVQ